MKRLSIALLLIGISLITIEANNLSKQRGKHLFLKRWGHAQRAPISIPIEAILDDHSIEVRFLENVDSPVTFQVKDKSGNIVFQDMMVTPNEETTYKISLEGFKADKYKLFYIEPNMVLVGDFEIE